MPVIDLKGNKRDMATVEKSGIYRIGEGDKADFIQLRSGQEVPDDYLANATYTEPIPEPGQPLGGKAAPAPANKADMKPDNKSAG